MRRTRTPLAVVVLLILAFPLAGCPKRPPNIVTPEGKIAYTANEVLKRVENLQNAAIAVDAVPNNGIPKDVIRGIVQFTVSAAKTLDKADAGWGPTLATAWAETKGKIPLKYLNDPRIQGTVIAVDLALAIFYPQGGSA